MAEHLIDNVYQVGGAGITHELDGASYLVLDEQSPDNCVLIDCGSPLGYSRLIGQLASFNVSPNAPLAIWATHAHYDHVAAAALLKNSTLFIHPDDRHAVEEQDDDLTATFLYGQPFPRIDSLANLHDGDEIAVSGTRVHSIHTPGHTPGSTSFSLTTVSGKNVLIAGDTLWGGYEQRIHSNIAKWRQSLNRLYETEADYVTFGHGLTRLVPNAMAHLALAQSRFMVAPRISHGGLYIDPWTEE